MPKSTDPKPPANYEAARSELESIIAAMEAGQTSLDDLHRQYERGTELLRYCRNRLDAVEQQIQVFENEHLKPLLDKPE